jgi:UDP-N-acetylglucosamine transferase subunit ALG13
MVNRIRPSYSIIYLGAQLVRTGILFRYGGSVRSRCDLTAAHAGAASGFTASEPRIPTVLTPRRAANREHATNDQVDTAKWLETKPGIFVVWSDDDLAPIIERAGQSQHNLQSLVPPSATALFLERIRNFLLTE